MDEDVGVDVRPGNAARCRNLSRFSPSSLKRLEALVNVEITPFRGGVLLARRRGLGAPFWAGAAGRQTLGDQELVCERVGELPTNHPRTGSLSGPVLMPGALRRRVTAPPGACLVGPHRFLRHLTRSPTFTTGKAATKLPTRSRDAAAHLPDAHAQGATPQSDRARRTPTPSDVDR